MKKIIISLISIVTLTFLGILMFSKKEESFNTKNYDDSPYITNTNNHSSYIDLGNNERNRPNYTHEVNISDYNYKDGLFEEDIPYQDTFKDDKNISKEGLYIPETGNIEFSVDILESGYYNLNVDYLNFEGRGSSIIRGIKIQDEYQFSEAENIQLPRFWVDEYRAEDRRKPGVNDLRPTQLENHLWTNIDLHDQMGYYDESFSFYFEKGLNKITLVSHREPFVLGSMTIYQAEEAISYETYINSHLNSGVKKIETDVNYTIEAENTLYKTSSTLIPIAEYSTYKFSPYERQVTRYNAIGGANWRVPGDEIAWNVKVEEEGLYLISLKVLQNYVRGQKVSRVLKVNGKQPFKEASNLQFDYNSDLRNYTLNNNGDNLYIYLEKGDNVLSLKSTIGMYGETVKKVNNEITKLRSLYREIVVRTGLNPDPIQDYMLHTHIKDLDNRLNEFLNTFEQIKKDIVELSEGRNSLVSSFDRIIYQLEKFIKDEKNIQKGLGELEQNIAALGSWVITVSEQPITIDTITVHGSNHKLDRVSTNFFERIWHEFMLFIESFKNTGDFGSTTKVDGPTIEVWVGTGRDQATIIRQLIDDTFTTQKNVNVNLKMVNMSVLLSATLSGNGPDIAIGVNQKLPVNWGIRNAIKDLTKFDDFEEVSKQFSESALKPLGYDGSVYALPDTEDFLIMFYREDVLKEVGINTIPKTWADIIDISPTLQKQHFDFYIPLLTGALSPVLYSMIEQRGGDLYIDNGRESGLLEPGTIDAFLEFTRFFTDYGFVLEANFINRFRSGEMPIGISNFTTYNSLAVFAPEINGHWDYALYPGTYDSDGNLNNQTTSLVTASIILEHTKEEEASWEFLKWWLSEETQIAYARGMEAILGSAARYPTANLKAFSKLPWPTKDYLILQEQRSTAVGIPTVPGDYIVGRYIDNAFRKVLNDNIIAQDSIYQYHISINEELARKRKELGLT